MEGSATVAANDGTHDLQKSLAFQDNLEENDEIAEVSDDKRFQRYHDILGKGVRTVLSSSPAPPRFLHITLCVKQIIESHVLSCRLLCGPARRRSRSRAALLGTALCRARAMLLAAAPAVARRSKRRF